MLCYIFLTDFKHENEVTRMHFKCAQDAGNNFSESKFLLVLFMYPSDFKHKLKSPEADKLHFDTLSVLRMEEMDSQGGAGYSLVGFQPAKRLPPTPLALNILNLVPPFYSKPSYAYDANDPSRFTDIIK